MLRRFSLDIMCAGQVRSGCQEQKSKNFAAADGDIFLGSLRKSQLGFDFGLLIPLWAETRWILRNLVSCKAELHLKTKYFGFKGKSERT